MTADPRLVELLGGGTRILVFTGAGISTGSGIPDFRGPQGIWKSRQPVYYQDFMSSEEARIEYWDGKPLEMVPGVTLIQCGGHFPGSAVLHWGQGADGKGAICVGDTLSVVMDRRYVSFMNSYPNLIPLSAADVRGIVEAILYQDLGEFLEENPRVGRPIIGKVLDAARAREAARKGRPGETRRCY